MSSCTVCGSTENNPRRFLLRCAVCQRYWHHRCLKPPMPDTVLIGLVNAYTKNPDSEDSYRRWKCTMHAPIELSDDDDDCIVIVEPPLQSTTKNPKERKPNTDVQARSTSLSTIKQPPPQLSTKESAAVVDLTVSSDEEVTHETKGNRREESSRLTTTGPPEIQKTQYSETVPADFTSLPSADQPVLSQEANKEERKATLAPVWVIEHAIKNGLGSTVPSMMSNDKGIVRRRNAPAQHRSVATPKYPFSLDISGWLRSQKAKVLS